MKAYSDNAPKPITIDVIGDIAHVSLTENVVETEAGFEHDYYLVKVQNRDSLMSDIESNLEVWLERAKLANASKPSIEERLSALEQIELERILYG